MLHNESTLTSKELEHVSGGHVASRNIPVKISPEKLEFLRRLAKKQINQVPITLQSPESIFGDPSALQ